MNKLKKDINANTLKNLYLFTGPEVFLSEFYVNDIRKRLLGDGADDFNLLTVSRTLPDISAADDFINSYPFMSDKKLLIIKDSGILKKAPDEDKKYWQKALASVPDYCIIIFCENDIDKRSVIYKALNSNGTTVEFNYQQGQTLITWIQKFIASNGKQIDSADAEYLIASCNPGMINLKREMEKLISCKSENPKITKSDIDRLVTKSIESRVFEMADDIAKGNKAAAYKKLEDIKALNIKPPEIIPAIFSKFASYRKIKLLSPMPLKQMAMKMNQREYFIKKDYESSANMTMEKIEKLMFLCKETDFKVKNGFSDGWTELMMIINL